jgi:hypothetical protein
MNTGLKEAKWIAVKVKRGFPAEVRGFRTKSDAEIQERRWRKKMNFDYDETAVLPLALGFAKDD